MIHRHRRVYIYIIWCDRRRRRVGVDVDVDVVVVVVTKLLDIHGYVHRITANSTLFDINHSLSVRTIQLESND